MRRIPTIAILDPAGTELWSGSMREFGKVSGREIVRDVADQFRTSLERHGRHEPAFVGGGAAQEFGVLLVEAA